MKPEETKIPCNHCKDGMTHCTRCDAWDRKIKCIQCWGNGVSNGLFCYPCQGKGRVECPNCAGAYMVKCVRCEGRGFHLMPSPGGRSTFPPAPQPVRPSFRPSGAARPKLASASPPKSSQPQTDPISRAAASPAASWGAKLLTGCVFGLLCWAAYSFLKAKGVF